jgi:hypothetical protein
MEKSNVNTYLGQKGYTIPKNEISIEKQNQIKKDLMVRPYTPGAPGNGGDTTFPAYRESSNKLYVPKKFDCINFCGLSIDLSTWDSAAKLNTIEGLYISRIFLIDF